jgi:hypothetical protein
MVMASIQYFRGMIVLNDGMKQQRRDNNKSLLYVGDLGACA